MLLYPVQIPEDDPHKEDLYVRSRLNSGSDSANGCSSGCRFEFSTFFNSFQASAWKNQTSLDSVLFSSRVRGRFSLEFFTVDEKGRQALFLKTEISGANKTRVALNSNRHKIIYPVLTSLEDNAAIEELGWHSEGEPPRRLHLAVVICTFRREEFIKKNVRLLEKGLLHEPEYYSLHVIDNDSSLKLDGNTKPLPSPNYGGSGGFTRGIMAALEAGLASHILLMDDDVDLDVSALQRMFAFYSFLNEEYHDCFFAGSMLRRDRPWLQYERAARWNGHRPYFFNRGIDLRRIENLAANTNPLPADEGLYSAWCFCAFPVGAVEKNGLPMPFFIRGDDVEFSLRNRARMLSLNGSGVWHEYLVNKKRPWLSFYHARNFPIVNFLNPAKTRTLHSAWFLLARTVYFLLRGYKDHLQALSDGMEDLLDGPRCLDRLPADQKHTAVMAIRSSAGSGRLAARCLGQISRLVTNRKSLQQQYRESLVYFSSADFWKDFYRRSAG